ncbi:hypothetical protein K6119_00655 [Paracrocinitomix mangrovi]|uniref:hypothetical protein n=1 Tax=Paracrocinitomix mangrovi TaxID=2862509 RepID=UPI001C8DAE3C|nr:hypothetical protein [Paracrocinitomix mangrovi]UKN02024.1 hypothetical protein K6119_00655 [Paracrocinitomix mangrovi]
MYKSLLIFSLLIVFFACQSRTDSKSNKEENQNEQRVKLLPSFNKKQPTIQETKFKNFSKKLDKAIHFQSVILLKELMYDTIFESSDICGYPGCLKDEFFEFHFTKDLSGLEDWKKLKIIKEEGFSRIKIDEAIVNFKGITEVLQAPSFLKEMDLETEFFLLKDSTPLKSKPLQSSSTISYLNRGYYTCNCCNYSTGILTDKKDNTWIKTITNNGKVGYISFNSTSLSTIKYLTVGWINNEWKIFSWYSGEYCAKYD